MVSIKTEEKKSIFYSSSYLARFRCLEAFKVLSEELILVRVVIAKQLHVSHWQERLVWNYAAAPGALSLVLKGSGTSAVCLQLLWSANLWTTRVSVHLPAAWRETVSVTWRSGTEVRPCSDTSTQGRDETLMRKEDPLTSAWRTGLPAFMCLYLCRSIRGVYSQSAQTVLKFEGGNRVRLSVSVWLVLHDENTRVRLWVSLLPVNVCHTELSPPPPLVVLSSPLLTVSTFQKCFKGELTLSLQETMAETYTTATNNNN